MKKNMFKILMLSALAPVMTVAMDSTGRGTAQQLVRPASLVAAQQSIAIPESSKNALYNFMMRDDLSRDGRTKLIEDHCKSVRRDLPSEQQFALYQFVRPLISLSDEAYEDYRNSLLQYGMLHADASLRSNNSTDQDAERDRSVSQEENDADQEELQLRSDIQFLLDNKSRVSSEDARLSGIVLSAENPQDVQAMTAKILELITADEAKLKAIVSSDNSKTSETETTPAQVNTGGSSVTSAASASAQGSQEPNASATTSAQANTGGSSVTSAAPETETTSAQANTVGSSVTSAAPETETTSAQANTVGSSETLAAPETETTTAQANTVGSSVTSAASETETTPEQENTGGSSETSRVEDEDAAFEEALERKLENANLKEKFSENPEEAARFFGEHFLRESGARFEEVMEQYSILKHTLKNFIQQEIGTVEAVEHLLEQAILKVQKLEDALSAKNRAKNEADAALQEAQDKLKEKMIEAETVVGKRVEDTKATLTEEGKNLMIRAYYLVEQTEYEEAQGAAVSATKAVDEADKELKEAKETEQSAVRKLHMQEALMNVFFDHDQSIVRSAKKERNEEEFNRDKVSNSMNFYRHDRLNFRATVPATDLGIYGNGFGEDEGNGFGEDGHHVPSGDKRLPLRESSPVPPAQQVAQRVDPSEVGAPVLGE